MSLKQATCRGCGRPIIWGVTGDGKKIPLDPKPAVYGVVEDEGNALATRMEGAMVTHFATCPKASDFSGRNQS